MRKGRYRGRKSWAHLEPVISIPYLSDYFCRRTGDYKSMFNSITNLISWNSIWNPYTFTDAKIIAASLFLAMIGSIVLTAILWGTKKAAVILKREMILFWLFTIFSATLLARKETAEPKINLELFWTIQYAWKYHSRIHWFYIIGNIALFIPLGFLLSINGKAFRSCVLTVLVGCVLSVTIEATQLFMKIGLCEFDDVFHNTWGTLLGYCMFRLITPDVKVYSKARKIFNILCTGVCAVIFFGTIIAFCILIRLNAPA